MYKGGTTIEISHRVWDDLAEIVKMASDKYHDEPMTYDIAIRLLLKESKETVIEKIKSGEIHP